MRLAVFGDIHANLEALQAVAADARTEGCSDFACTGDIVGYNANPNECADVVRAMSCPVVCGNHDEDAAGSHPLYGLNPRAHHSLTWTREQLTDVNRQWLAGLPHVLRPGGYTLVHATLSLPENWGYVLNATHAASNFRHQEDAVCFHGHTHLPLIYSTNHEGVISRGQFAHIRPAQRYLCNVGSVGKPREKDQRATYAIYDDDSMTVSIRRVDYDIARALEKSRAAGLID